MACHKIIKEIIKVRSNSRGPIFELQFFGLYQWADYFRRIDDVSDGTASRDHLLRRTWPPACSSKAGERFGQEVDTPLTNCAFLDAQLRLSVATAHLVDASR